MLPGLNRATNSVQGRGHKGFKYLKVYKQAVAGLWRACTSPCCRKWRKWS